MKETVSGKEKKRSSTSRRPLVRALLLFLVIYTVLCFIYWYVEIGPKGSKSFLDILLWNNINVILGRGYTDYLPKSWMGRVLLMIFVFFSMLFLSIGSDRCY